MKPIIYLAVVIIITYLIHVVFDDTILGRIGAVLCLLSTVLMFVSILLIPLCRADDRIKLIEYHEVKDRLNKARKLDNNVELAAMQLKIVEVNSGIKQSKYWRDNGFSWYCLDEYCNLKPIE